MAASRFTPVFARQVGLPHTVKFLDNSPLNLTIKHQDRLANALVVATQSMRPS